MLEVMLPNLVQTPVQTPPVTIPVPVPGSAPVQTTPAPVQTPSTKPQRTRVQAPVQDQDPAPVVVNTTPVVNAPLVAAPVVSAPAGVQQLVGQVQDLVIQHVAVVSQDQVGTPMEVEDEDSILQRLFFKKYGRALPVETEKEKEKESEVDQIKFVIDLTDDTEEMEDDTTPPLVPIPVVKTEAPEAPEIADVNVVKVAEATKQRRASRRLEIIEMAKARKAITAFGQSLRKSEVIPEKEAPLAAGNVIADTDSDMSEDRSVINVNNESGNTVESLTTAEAIEMAEQAIAESDAAIAANQKEIDKFFN